MALDTLSIEDKKRLSAVMAQGLDVTQQITDLREGLRDTLKTVAEELNIKPSALAKAIRTAFKASMEEQKVAMDVIEEILHITGRL